MTLYSSLFLNTFARRFLEYRASALFWGTHLGAPVLLGGVAALAGWTLLSGCLLWAPLGGAVFAWGLGRWTTPGGAALWTSLAVASLVVPVIVTQFDLGEGFLVGGLLVDELSGPFVLLTVSLGPLVVLASLDTVRHSEEVYYFLLLGLLGLLVPVFCVTHFLVFYLLFEVLGFPMFVLIGIYGPRHQRIGAAYKFFVYTFVGSAFILPVLIYLYLQVGSTDLHLLLGHQFTRLEEVFFFGAAALPFGVKVPVVPLHLWLPEAHVEAPTPVSMVLAALLLKTGGYGLIRFVVPVFPVGAYLWGPTATAVALLSVGLASVYALVQVDLKRMIAYASVAHMSLVLVGILAGVLTGGVYLMVAHGYISAGLFAGIGVLYDRYHTRTIRYFGGLVSMMPLAGLAFFVVTLGNLSFPFTGGFVGEFLLLVELAQRNLVTALLGGTTVFLSLCYGIWLFNRVFYGRVDSRLQRHQDLTPREVGVALWCGGATVVTGFSGGYFQEYSHNCYDLLGGFARE